MTYTLVGTGNMAHFLASRFSHAGIICDGVYGRDAQKVPTVAAIAKADTIGSIEDIKEGSDCCIIAVSDAALAEVSQGLSFSKTVLIHTTGSQPLSVLPAQHTGVLWCIYSILKEELPQHRNIPVIREGNTEQARAILKELATALTDTSYEVSYQQRQYLHLTAVFGNNFTNHLMAICEAICKEQNLPFSLLLPILKQTFERIEHASPELLQTGPARREDEITLYRQTDQLEEHPDWQTVYLAISASIENWYSITKP